MSIGSSESAATTPVEKPVKPAVEDKKPTPINYASYSKKGPTRTAGLVNYAMYGNLGDENFVDVGGVNYAKYAGRMNMSGSQVQDIIMSPEYTPEQLQKIIELLGVLELSTKLLPEIVTWAKQRGSGGADVLQTGAAVAIKKGVQDWLVKNKSPDGKSSLPMKAAGLLVKNVELILELYNGKEMVAKADPLKLSTANKAKVFAWHGLDGLLSRLGIVGQAADFFFNSSLKSVGALEDQVAKHKERLRSYYGVPESYIDEPSKGLEYYKDLQVKLHHG